MPSGIEPAVLQLIAQCINQLRYLEGLKNAAQHVTFFTLFFHLIVCVTTCLSSTVFSLLESAFVAYVFTPP
jgi:hypothetical protein